MKLIKRIFRKATPHPVAFPEVNFTYVRPESLTKEQCGDLPCFRGENFTVSCWQLTPRDRLLALFTGKIWLMLMMNWHPPVCVTPESPFPAWPAKTRPAAKASVTVSMLKAGATGALIFFAIAAVVFALKLKIEIK